MDRQLMTLTELGKVKSALRKKTSCRRNSQDSGLETHGVSYTYREICTPNKLFSISLILLCEIDRAA